MLVKLQGTPMVREGLLGMMQREDIKEKSALLVWDHMIALRLHYKQNMQGREHGLESTKHAQNDKMRGQVWSKSEP